MKLFDISFATVLFRFYLMMGIVIISFVIGLPFLSLLAMPVAASVLLGMRIEWKKTV